MLLSWPSIAKEIFFNKKVPGKSDDYSMNISKMELFFEAGQFHVKKKYDGRFIYMHCWDLNM